MRPRPSAGLHAAIRFQRWKNLISAPSTDNPIAADAPALVSLRTTARSGGTRERAVAVLSKSFPERLIDQPLQRQLNPSALRRRLRHEDHEHIVLRIDKEEGAGDAVPAVFAKRPC